MLLPGTMLAKMPDDTVRAGVLNFFLSRLPFAKRKKYDLPSVQHYHFLNTENWSLLLCIIQ